MLSAKAVRGALGIVVLTAAGVWAQFTPIVNDFSSTIAPFTAISDTQGEVAHDPTKGASAPGSLRLTDLRPRPLDSTSVGVQASFWRDTVFPSEPIKFSCMLLDTSFQVGNSNRITMHFNVGILTDSAHGWYKWLGLYRLYYSTFDLGWALCFDDEVSDIGSKKSWWEGPADPTFQQRYDQEIARMGRKFPLALTLLIELEGGTIWIDDLSVTMGSTAVKQPLVVRRDVREAAGTRYSVLPNGRLVATETVPAFSAHGFVLKFQNGRTEASALAR